MVDENEGRGADEVVDSPEALAEAWEKTWHIVDRYKAISKATNFVGFDTVVMDSIKLLSATPRGVIEWELDITPYYANINGVMHGGAAGVIFDMCTTTALGPLGRKGYWDFLGGVTRSLNISYLKAIPIGTTIRIKSRVMQIGRTMAMLRGEMTSTDGKTIYCTCEHHKVAVPTREEHLSAEYDIRGNWTPGGLPLLNAGTEVANGGLEKGSKL